MIWRKEVLLAPLSSQVSIDPKCKFVTFLGIFLHHHHHHHHHHQQFLFDESMRGEEMRKKWVKVKKHWTPVIDVIRNTWLCTMTVGKKCPQTTHTQAVVTEKICVFSLYNLNWSIFMAIIITSTVQKPVCAVCTHQHLSPLSKILAAAVFSLPLLMMKK